MKTTFLLLPLAILILATYKVNSQSPTIEWQKCIGGSHGDYAKSIKPTSDGGYIITGFSASNNGDITGHHGDHNFYDISVVKLDERGEIQWQRSLGGTIDEMPSHVLETSDGGYLIAGHALSSNGDVSGYRYSMDYWLIKLDATGNILWEETYGGTNNEYCYSVTMAPDGGYLMVGCTASDDGDVTVNHGDIDFWLVKVNSLGILEWQKTYGGSAAEEAYSAETVPTGGFVVTGYTESNDGNVTGNHGMRDYWVIKVDNAGNLEWQKTLGGSFQEEARSIRATADGGFIVAGQSRSNDFDVTGNHLQTGNTIDFWIVKLSNTGNIQWQKCYGGYFNELAFSIAPTPDGGYIVAGSVESWDGDVKCTPKYVDFWIVKLSSTGQMEWQKIIGGSYFDEAYSIEPVPSGGYVVAGVTSSPEIEGYHPDVNSLVGDFLIIKLTDNVLPEIIPTIAIDPPPTRICRDSVVTLSASISTTVPNPVYQWQRNGINIGFNNPDNSLLITNELMTGDIMTCILFYKDPCNREARVDSPPVTINLNTIDPPYVSITVDNNSVCHGTSVTFNANAIGGVGLSVFQWKVNGINIGTNNNSFTSAALNDSDIITCLYSDDSPCLSDQPVTSNQIVMKILSNLAPSVSISASATTICSGTTVTFNASSSSSGINPSYQWKVNGIDIGINNPNFKSAVLANGDKIQCLITQDPSVACSSDRVALSNTISMTVNNGLPATVTVKASGNDVCEGTYLNFTAIAENAGSNPTYQWKLNNTIVGNNSLSFSSDKLSNNDQLTCIVLADNDACSSTPVSSNIVNLVIHDLPKISLTPTDTIVPPGSSLKLAASVAGPVSSFTWSPPNLLIDPLSLSPTITPITESKKYLLTVESDHGCTASMEANVKVFIPLYMPNAFSPNGDGVNDVFRIPSNTFLNLINFSIFDRWGNQVFYTKDISQGWNGQHKGRNVDGGVYIYLIRGSNVEGTVIRKGNFLLIR